MTNPLDEFPGPDPQGEPPSSLIHPFADECKSFLAEEAALRHCSYGGALLTHSDKWGLVYRVDACSDDRRRVARFVMFRRDGDKEGFGTA